MINFPKKLIALFSFFLGTTLQATSTHQEIVEELAHIRATKLQLKENFNPSASYYLDRIDETKILDATTSTTEYLTKSAAFWFPATLIRMLLVNMVLLTPDNAPKTYELISQAGQKIGYSEMPLVYLVSDEKFFNAFASGLLQSMSIVALGEKLVKEATSIDALEFVIAHELAHIKNRHMVKRATLSFATSYLFDEIAWRYTTYENQIQMYLLKLLAINLVGSWYSRVTERDADMTAAQSLGAQGGVDFFTLLKNKEAQPVSYDYALLQQEIDKTSLKDSNIFALRVAIAKALSLTTEKIGNVLSIAAKPFKSHPSHEERIAYLQELLEEQTAREGSEAAPII